MGNGGVGAGPCQEAAPAPLPPLCPAPLRAGGVTYRGQFWWYFSCWSWSYFPTEVYLIEVDVLAKDQWPYLSLSQHNLNSEASDSAVTSEKWILEDKHYLFLYKKERKGRKKHTNEVEKITWVAKWKAWSYNAPDLLLRMVLTLSWCLHDGAC